MQPRAGHGYFTVGGPVHTPLIQAAPHARVPNQPTAANGHPGYGRLVWATSALFTAQAASYRHRRFFIRELSFL
jgi:hypothetical protein